MRYLLFLYLLATPYGYTRNERFADISAQRQTKTIDDQTLVMSGVAVHRRFIFDIYQLTLYLASPTDDAEAIINSEEIIYAQMKFLRDLSSQDLREGFEDTFKLNCLDECPKLSPSMERLLSSIPDMTKGETIEFIFYPNKSLIKNSQGTRLSFEGPDFGRFFLRSWLGNSPPSERFKKELLRKSK